MSAILRLAASSVLIFNRADVILDEATAKITTGGASGVFMVLMGILLSGEMNAGTVVIRAMPHMIGPGALDRNMALPTSGSPVGPFPPLGVLCVQFANDLFRPMRLDADHRLFLKFGRLTGEDVENGPTVRFVHPKRVAVCHVRVLYLRPLSSVDGSGFCDDKAEVSTTTIQSATHTFRASAPYEESADATGAPTIPFAPVRPVATASGPWC
ncbi:hypothetical protein RFN25_13020 [Mesorhizobium abyssinicae]|uniref:hypothetical protein n=1 Tax=Mesorhizobium abyssinicae TaxID=1209958 RepID=UPI002A23EC60|nr:hypothetical protein [Mesorhizobium abyssinicae]MDX8434351.1 hypothetical protein [Mesorhizobium abyssinicae]